jgi:Fe2+ transport system protein B
MSNCIVAQSGGPSSVINATVAGVVKANQMNPIYEHVYGGLNGIEGILQERFVDLTNMPEHVIGAFFQNLLEEGIAALTNAVDAWMSAAQVNSVVHSLVIDGIFNGVGTVVSFVPIIVVLFFFLSILEDSGYMARVAFVMDKLLRKIGLSGRSIVPMLIGFGCTVPGVMNLISDILYKVVDPRISFD